MVWLKQNRRRRRRRVIVGAAFSDELQRRFVEEIPRLRLGEGLCDLLRTLRNSRRYSSFVLMLSQFYFRGYARRRIKNNGNVMVINVAFIKCIVEIISNGKIGKI